MAKERYIDYDGQSYKYDEETGIVYKLICNAKNEIVEEEIQWTGYGSKVVWDGLRTEKEDAEDTAHSIRYFREREKKIDALMTPDWIDVWGDEKTARDEIGWHPNCPD